MSISICVTCGTSFPAPQPPGLCPICDEERQFVPAEGQKWTTPDRLTASHSNAWRQLEADLFEIRTFPSFGIGQRAFLVRTANGNVLWDCIATLDEATVSLVDALGGLSAIAISHPHYYTTMQDWSVAFDAPVYIHARDREWVMRPDNRLVFWEEDERSIGIGLTLVRLGGHFPGGAVLHWEAGADGRGAILAGDIIQVGADRKSVSFLWSYPNRLPLSGSTVQRIAARAAARPYERLYGAFGLHIREDAEGVVRRSAARYCELLGKDQT